MALVSAPLLAASDGASDGSPRGEGRALPRLHVGLRMLLAMDAWGAAVRDSRTPWARRALAVGSLLFALVSCGLFYYRLSKSEAWAMALSSLLQDSLVTLCGLFVVFSGALPLALEPWGDFRWGAASGAKAEVKPVVADASPRGGPGFDAAQALAHDKVLSALLAVFVYCAGSSIVTDLLDVFDLPQDIGAAHTAVVVVGLVVEEVLFSMGFFYVACVSRCMQLRLRELEKSIDAPSGVAALSRGYLGALETSVEVAARMGLLPALLLVLAALELTTVVQRIFEVDGLAEFDKIGRLSVVRLVISLCANVVALALSAGHVERRALEVAYRLAELVLELDADADEPRRARIYQLQMQVRAEPVVLRCGRWFDLSSEFCNTVAVAVVSLLLIVAGVRAPELA